MATPPPIPRGLEVLIKKAAVDPDFRQLLLEQRAAAARQIDLSLEPAESLMLNNVPREQLERTIDRTTVKPEHRAAFLGKAAAAMLVAVGFAGLVGCGERPPAAGGARIDRPNPPAEETQKPAEGSERPERIEPTKGVRLEKE